VPAKLFAGLAVGFLICAGLAWLNPFPAADVYLHDTYIVFGAAFVLLFCAVASLNFAVLYYAATRFFHARWNLTLSVLHVSLFVCFGVSLSVVFAVSRSIGNSPDAGQALRWLAIPWFLGILSLFASFLVFGVNLTLTVVQIVRARFASH
jgi:hypothetical protein